VGVYAYGRPPLFTARLDSPHFRYQQSLVSPQEEYFTLEHQNGLTTARAMQPFSQLRQRQELVSMGADFLLLDLSNGAISREAATLSSLLNHSEPRKTGKGKQPAIMRGNFDGVLV
jgi:putative protease